jgi:poly-gamma-glutamate capsule biosynthesis protein CapA/YwtB (metallophosphatase superfamily)
MMTRRNYRPSTTVVRAVSTAMVVALLSAGIAVTAAWIELLPADSQTEPLDASPSMVAIVPPDPTPTPPPDAVLTLVAVGDVLPHLAVDYDARTSKGYDFTPEFAPVQEWVAGADLALFHMEVPVAPAGVAPSGYPLFAAPPQLVTSLATNGWDGCSTASNHSVDQGTAGIVSTLDTCDAVGLGHAGTARTPDEAASTTTYTFTREGQTITIAHIATSYGTNGNPVAEPWQVDLIDPDAIVAEATAARTAGADLVVASVHCCAEYVAQPTEQQVQVAQALADSGEIDLVIGHHAHVPEPIVRLEGGPDSTGMWVAYGLGNFISNQGAYCCSAASESGLLLEATIRKTVGERARVESVGWTAVTVDRSDHRVYPLSQAAAARTGIGTLSASEVAARMARITAVVGEHAAQQFDPPVPSGPGPVVGSVQTGGIEAAEGG